MPINTAMTPFPPKLLSYLKSLFPDAASPLSRFVPLLSTVLSSLNEPELILELFDDACLNLVDSFQPPDWIEVVGGKSLSAQVLGKLIIAVRSREALLKSFPLVGFPLTISALTTFSTHLSRNHPDVWTLVEQIEASHPFPTAFEPLGDTVPLDHPVDTGVEKLEEVSRGRKFFNKIYGKVATKVIESLRWGHPNLVDSALKLIYTPVLSDTRVLQDPLDSSLLCLALCFASDLPPQTKGHFKGAQNLGATPEQTHSLLSSIRCLMEWKGVRLRMDRMEFLGEVNGLGDLLDKEEKSGL